MGTGTSKLPEGNHRRVLEEGTTQFSGQEIPAAIRHRTPPISTTVQFEVSETSPDDLVNSGSHESAPAAHHDLCQISDKHWAEAEYRYFAIEPLIHLPRRSGEAYRRRAESLGLNVSTLYDWVARFKERPVVTSLVLRKRRDVGKSRLGNDLDSIIDEVLVREYLTPQRKSLSYVIREVRRTCFDRGVKPPHSNTLRNRINRIPERTVTEKRLGARAAKERFEPNYGKIWGADAPLDLVQIDHTKMDMILVDDMNRLPIGRPYLTIATDVYSRMVCGFYVSLDPVGSLSTGLCLSFSILDKTDWLASHGVEGEWPAVGIPKVIHTDNAKEFHGKMFRRACSEYGIVPAKREKGKPWHGGHIERIIGTLNGATHAVPGTTFANVHDRAKYDSEGKAILTLSELENWLATYIVSVYHQDYHSEIMCTPIEKFKSGVNEDKSGRYTERKWTPLEKQKLRLDFMPFFERTVQNDGVSKDSIKYFHDVLRRWIHSIDPNSRSRKQRLLFRWDPRDISRIWVRLPPNGEYHEVPYRNTSYPSFSYWELKAVRSKILREGKASVNEAALMKGLTRLRNIVIDATRKTASARRNAQRTKISDPVFLPIRTNDSSTIEDGDDESPVGPYEDLVPLRRNR